MTRPILLDTNILIWALNDDRSLTRRMRAAISSPTAAVHLSVVSAWEIVIKYQSGKLSFDVPVEEVLSRILDGTVWPVLPVLPAHIPELLALPTHHRDPFDRQIIAQALAEKIAVVTPDDKFKLYTGLKIIW